MNQTEEAAWRLPFLRMYETARDNGLTAESKCVIQFHKSWVCLKGFAIIAGGPNYIRTCFRDLAKISDGLLPSHDIDLGDVPEAERQSLKRLLRIDSHETVALRSYLEEVVEQLGEHDPVSGRIVILVRHVFTDRVHEYYTTFVNHSVTIRRVLRSKRSSICT